MQATKGPCCPPDSEPFMEAPADYVPAGREVVVTSTGTPMRVYVVGDDVPGREAGVIVAHDIFGGASGRHKMICDQVSKRSGVVVCMPDLFHDSYPADEKELPLWKIPAYLPTAFSQIVGRKWSPGVLQDVEAAHALLQDLAVRRFGMMGFCYGAWVVMRSCAADDSSLPGLCCGVSVHPSVHQIVGFEGTTEQAVVKGVRTPQLVMSTSSEPSAWKEGGDVEKWLAGLPDGAGAGSKVVDLPSPLIHGFSTRGNASKPSVRAGIQQVMDEVAIFFDSHLRP